MPRSYWLPAVALGLVLCAAVPQAQSQSGNAQAPQANIQPSKPAQTISHLPARTESTAKDNRKTDKRNAQVSGNGKPNIVQSIISFAARWRDSFDILFAALVAIFTAVSGGVSFVQWLELRAGQRMTLAALKIARAEASASSEAARAAKRSADAAETMIDSIERPYVYPAEMRLYVGQRLNGVDQAPHVGVRFKNFGRSPAILGDADLHVFIRQKDSHSNFPFSHKKGFTLYGMIGAGEMSEEVKMPPAKEIESFLPAIADGSKILCLSVGIRIETVTGGYTKRGARYRWVPSEGRFVHGV